jgi:hypothetical protein
MVGGLIVSQALTLFTTPVIYLYVLARTRDSVAIDASRAASVDALRRTCHRLALQQTAAPFSWHSVDGKSPAHALFLLARSRLRRILDLSR